jgi:uncharacterized protein YciI
LHSIATRTTGTVAPMQFMVLAWDFAGEVGVAKRDAARPAHGESIRALWEQGRVVLGAGILDDDGKPRGSLVIVDYPTRADVDTYLQSEPFVTQSVWEQIEVHPVWVPDFYLGK